MLGIAAVLGGLLLTVWAARAYLHSAAGSEFLAHYPGAAPMPAHAPIGIPAWLAWSHFFNLFLLTLIVRSGIQIRQERRAPAYWSPKWNPQRKISLTIWLHQSLDILWIINGVIFFGLLFGTGQWMKIVPTSWEVFPNALSAGLQYLSLNWPAENGWVHYNALQQLAYFSTVFIASPLAIVTGIRMSGIWPATNTALNQVFPATVARRLHFPVMAFFVAFIIVHVLLVFLTGPLRNLNHMFAAQGSTDPTAYADNWLGFGLFAVAAVVTIGAVYAARPLLLAPLARLFGKVTNR